jgi:hypothetical protein
MGDGVLAYFGYPIAHQDDPELAVRAGLSVIAAARRLETSEPLQVRVGLATGLAVVGDLIGAGAAQEQAVDGETPNLAARLQHSALFPFIGQLERSAGFERDETPSAKLNKLEAFVAANAPTKIDVASLAEPLRLPFEGRNPAFDLTPSARRKRDSRRYRNSLPVWRSDGPYS